MWIKDPVTALPSVSLTIFTASFFLLVTAGGLEMFELVKSTSMFSEMYFGAAALYFGRRIQFNNKTFSSESAEKLEQQIKETINE